MQRWRRFYTTHTCQSLLISLIFMRFIYQLQIISLFLSASYYNGFIFFLQMWHASDSNLPPLQTNDRILHQFIKIKQKSCLNYKSKASHQINFCQKTVVMPILSFCGPGPWWPLKTVQPRRNKINPGCDTQKSKALTPRGTLGSPAITQLPAWCRYG